MYRIVQIGRKTRKVALTFGLALLALAPASCGAGRFIPSKTNQAWTGPTIWIESTPQWTVVAQPPIGGWQINLVQIMEELGRTEVFITMQPPNPAFIVTPVPVEQRIATPIRRDTHMWVYARQMNWQGRPTSGPFSLAAKSEDAKPPHEPAEASPEPAESTKPKN